MPKRLRDDVMCFRLQIHSQWMMKTHWRAQSQRTHLVRRSDTRTPRTKQVDSGQESLRVGLNIQKHCIHRRATTWVRRSRKAQHSTGQSPRRLATIPSFSACILKQLQRFSRQDWLAAKSHMSSENVLVPNKLCRCQNLYLYTVLLSSFVLFMFLYCADIWCNT